MEEEKKEIAKFLTREKTDYSLDEIAKIASGWSLSPYLIHHLSNTNQSLTNSAQIKILEEDTNRWRLIHFLQASSMLDVNSALKDAGVKCIWFKGSVLSYMIYPEPHLRPKSDLDCLVPESDFELALQVFYKLEYTALAHEDWIQTVAKERLWHHVELQHKNHQNVIIELHRHLLAHMGRKLLPVEHLNRWINQAIEIDVLGQNLYTLRHEHHFLYMCAHVFLQHGESDIGFLQILDIYQFIRKYKLDWQVVLTEAQSLNWISLVVYSLKRLQYYFGKLPEDAQFATNLFVENEFNSTSYKILKENQVFQNDYKYLRELSLKDKLITVMQLTFPSAQYMRMRYKIPNHRPIIPYYIYRLFKLAATATQHWVIRLKLLFFRESN